MTTIELKKAIICKIAMIDDEAFLNALKTIIDTKSEPVIYKTTPEQREAIRKGQAQIERGEFITNEQLNIEINRWLKDK